MRHKKGVRGQLKAGHVHALWLIAVGLIPLLLYIATLPEAVSFEDSAEFVTVSAVLGVPHPSGYPLYVFLGRLFTLLPFGEIPWRVALLSAVAAAAAISVLFAVACRVVRLSGAEVTWKARLLIAVVLMQFAVSETWWSQAITAEVYTLHVLLIGLVTLAFTQWLLHRKVRHLALACGLFGLMCSNHLFLALVAAPFLAFACLMADPSAIRRFRAVGLSALAFIAGLSPYALMYARIRLSDTRFVLGDVSTPGAFLSHVFRAQYADVGLVAWNKFGLVASAAGRFVVEQGPLLAVLSVSGFIAAVLVRKREVRAFALWGAGVIAGTLLIILLRSHGWTQPAEYVYRVYAIPGMAFGALFAALGAVAVFRLFSLARWGLTPFLRGLTPSLFLFLALAAIPVMTAFVNFPKAAPYADPFVEEHMRDTLASLPDSAALIVGDYGVTTGDSELFTLAYLQIVEGFRRDVSVVQYHGIRSLYSVSLPASFSRFSETMQQRMVLESVLSDSRFAERPVFTTFPAELLRDDWRSVPNGYVFRFMPADGPASSEGSDTFLEGSDPVVDASGVPSKTPSAAEGSPSTGSGPSAREPVKEFVEVRFPDQDLLQQPSFGWFVSHAMYNYASYIADSQGNKAALEYLIRAIELDPIPMSHDYMGFMAHRERVMGEID